MKTYIMNLNLKHFHTNVIQPFLSPIIKVTLKISFEKSEQKFLELNDNDSANLKTYVVGISAQN